MQFQKIDSFQYDPKRSPTLPNQWDIAAFIIFSALLASLAWAASEIAIPYDIGGVKAITLDPRALPGYAARTVLRMLIALMFSLLFTLIIAPLAARNSRAEQIIIPMIDILQSIPVLGMQSITIVGFIHLFKGSMWGPEFAAIFALFTSQVWNMTLSLYQSLRMIPGELQDTARIFHLSAWQRFWRIELPRATPGLLWNAMISLSGGWFFVVAAEAISVSNQNILLPGIGSYISVAIAARDLTSVIYAIIAMLVVILLYDQLLFRPLLTWAERFRHDAQTDEPTPQSWFYRLLKKTRWMQKIEIPITTFKEAFINPSVFNPIRWQKDEFNRPIAVLAPSHSLSHHSVTILGKILPRAWDIILILIIAASLLFLLKFIRESVDYVEVRHVFFLGAITAIKVALLVIMACIIWIPIGVWIGLNPKLSPIIQPIVQFIAAFPANLIYPIAVTLIVHYQLNPNIWSSPLMILGTQWYILFNVVAAAQNIPRDLQMVAKSFSLKGWMWWKRLALPAIFPYAITGAMAAAAGSWNASIVADVLSWGDQQLVSVGLGSYIVKHTTSGDFPRIALGVFVMCCYVLLINRLVWSRLYQLAANRFTLE